MTVPVLPTEFDAADLELATSTIAHWRGDDLSVDLVNGPLGTFARGSNGTVADGVGTLFTLPNAAPRWEPRDWNGTGTRDTMGLVLESTRTNLCTQSEAFELWTAQNGATATANQITAPDGALSADLLNTPTAVGSSGFSRACTFTGNGEKCVSLFLKAGTAATTDVGLWETQLANFRHFVRVTWTAGVPTLSVITGAGTLYPVVAFADGWYRIAFSVSNVVAANSNVLYLYPAGSGATTGTVYAWGVQVENTLTPTSYIATASSTVARTEETLSWAIDWRPRPFGFLVEFIEGGKRVSDGYVFSISNNATTGAYFGLACYNDAGTNKYALYHGNGVAGNGVGLGGVSQIGDRVAIRGQLYADGSLQLWQSINGAAEVATPRSGVLSLASTWGLGSARLRLGAYGTNAVVAGAWFKRLKLVPGIPDALSIRRGL